MSVEVGETVWLFDVNRKGRTEGTVTKVGRKLVTIRHGLYNTESTFRLDTQRSNDEYQHQWFKTPEQAARDDRRQAALAILREARVRLDYGCSLRLETIEAVAALVSGDTTGGDEK